MLRAFHSFKKKPWIEGKTFKRSFTHGCICILDQFIICYQPICSYNWIVQNSWWPSKIILKFPQQDGIRQMKSLPWRRLRRQPSNHVFLGSSYPAYNGKGNDSQNFSNIKILRKTGSKLAYFEQNIFVNMQREHSNRPIKNNMPIICVYLNEFVIEHIWMHNQSIFGYINQSIWKTYLEHISDLYFHVL